MKSLWLLVAVLIGFALGTLWHPTSGRASGGVYVKRANMSGATFGLGTNVVGFSCTGSGSDVECYVAME